MEEEEEKEDDNNKSIALFDPSVDENWRLPTFFDVTRGVDEKSGNQTCKIDFNRTLFAQMAGETEVPEFFPLPFESDAFQAFLKRRSESILATALSFPFPDVMIRAPPLFAALTSFGMPMLFSSPDAQYDLTMSARIFFPFKSTSWKMMLRCYVTTLLVLGETPKEVVRDLYETVIHQFTSEIDRLLVLMNRRLFAKNGGGGRGDGEISIQHYHDCIQKIIQKHNNVDALPQLDVFIRELHGNRVSASVLKHFWSVLCTFMPLIARTFELAILRLVFGQKTKRFAPVLLFPIVTGAWLVDVERISQSNCPLLIEIQEWPLRQIKHFREKLQLLHLASTDGLFPSKNDSIEFHLWEAQLIRYLDNPDYYYGGVHFLALWFEFFVHAVLMNRHDNEKEDEEEHDEKDEQLLLQLAFNKLNLL